METQHTKGDWKRYKNTSLIESEDGVAICRVNKKDLEANAKLIAAAPELLELAYEMRIVMDHLTGRMGEQMEIEVNKQIDSAIKKATE